MAVDQIGSPATQVAGDPTDGGQDPRIAPRAEAHDLRPQRAQALDHRVLPGKEIAERILELVAIAEAQALLEQDLGTAAPQALDQVKDAKTAAHGSNSRYNRSKASTTCRRSNRSQTRLRAATPMRRARAGSSRSPTTRSTRATWSPTGTT